MDTPTEDQPPPPAPEMSPAKVAYMNAAVHVGNIMSHSLATQLQQNGSNLGPVLQELRGSGMNRELEVVALVRLLAHKGLITEDEFYTAFVNTAAAMVAVLRQVNAEPQIAIARSLPPRGP